MELSCCALFCLLSPVVVITMSELPISSNRITPETTLPLSLVFRHDSMAPHSKTLAWKIPWTEEPGRLQSMGSLRVGHDWATSLSRIGEGNGNPLQCSCLENPRDGGAWWAAVYGVAHSRTRLKRLSSSSSTSLQFVLFDLPVTVSCDLILS